MGESDFIVSHANLLNLTKSQFRQMVSFPNCKINLGLNIIRKRADGYHDLETVFYPVAFRDVLEVIKFQDTSFKVQELSNQYPDSYRKSTINFSSTGLPINGPKSDNLCVKAYHLLQQHFPDLPAVQMHLHKVIPMGAGLGGGSADGAFALQLLNNIFKLNLSNQQLINYALQLGSDCPFFIDNKPCFATSRGEKMQPIDLNLSTYQLVIINPKIHIGTSWSFGNITPQIPTTSILQIIQHPIETWKNELINDFEKPAINKYPEIGNIINTLYNNGAIYSAMTGSGSSVFGIFPKKKIVYFSFPEHYFTFCTT